MERRTLGEGLGNRPDMAYFLLLGLCGAAFLLTIGGILTYVAFNPGSIDGHPHSALSHIPHFHHHVYPHHQNSHHPGYHHPAGESHHPPSITHHAPTLNHTQIPHSTRNSSNFSNSNNLANSSSQSTNLTKSDSNDPTSLSPSTNSTKPGDFHPVQVHDSTMTHHDPTLTHHDPNLTHHLNSSMSEAAYEAKAKQSLILAIIGPLCLLMGIIVTIIVGVLALKYDCDHEPEPNISFLRLRSEMSLNFDPDKNNYELLRPSSSIEAAGGHFSINPTGLPDSSS